MPLKIELKGAPTPDPEPWTVELEVVSGLFLRPADAIEVVVPTLPADDDDGDEAPGEGQVVAGPPPIDVVLAWPRDGVTVGDTPAGAVRLEPDDDGWTRLVWKGVQLQSEGTLKGQYTWAAAVMDLRCVPGAGQQAIHAWYAEAGGSLEEAIDVGAAHVDCPTGHWHPLVRWFRGLFG